LGKNKHFPRSVNDIFDSSVTGFRARFGNLMTFTVDENTQLTLVQEVGVDVLEMDTVFTKDGVPVIWHDVGVIRDIF
jgi:glycerophosphoryl diester phosphodiesterase